jgi:glycosyltransferase involved in cell wall biosynthesis
LKVLADLETEVASWEILVLDDASSDGSYGIMNRMAEAEPRIRVFRNESNCGIYDSYTRLFALTRGQYVYFTASDGQWPAENLATLYRHLKVSQSDLVIGVRRKRWEVYSPWRALLSYGFNVIPRCLFGIRAIDANSIKLGVREVFVLPLRSRSFFGEIERLIVARDKGYRIAHAPIRFLKRTSGKAQGARWRNICDTLHDLARYVLKIS